MSNRFGLIACSLLLALTACGGGGGAGDGSSTAAPPVNGKGSGSSPVTPPPSNNIPSNKSMAGFAYVTHVSPMTVSAFRINATTGMLSEVAGSPFTADRNVLPGPDYVTAHPSGKFVYVVNTRNSSAGGLPPVPGVVAAFAVDAITGELSEVAGSPFTADFNPYCLKIDPSGRFAFVPNYRNVSVYAINATTGALSEIAGSPFAAAEGWNLSMAIHPTGTFAYLAHYGSPGITTYAINATTGALTSIGVVAVAPYAGTITVDPSGKFVYLTDSGASRNSGGVLTYRVNATTGALSEVAGSPFAAGRNPDSIAVDPSGKFAYVTGYLGLDRVVAAYTINAATGALSEIVGALYYVPPGARSVTIDDSGRFVYVIHSGGIFGFTVDVATGRLSSPGNFATSDGSYITANRR